MSFDLPDPDEFAAKFAACVRERLLPLDQPQLLDWDDAPGVIPLQVDGFFVADTGKFLPKGAEPEMNERRVIEGSNGGYTIFNGLDHDYYRADDHIIKKWVKGQASNSICIKKNPNAGTGICDIIADNYGNFVARFPHVTIYVLFSLVPLHAKLAAELFRGTTPEYLKLRLHIGGPPLSELGQYSGLGVAGLPTGYYIDPPILQTGRRHISERSAPERELLAKLCSEAAKQYSRSAFYKQFALYRQIQAALSTDVREPAVVKETAFVEVSSPEDAAAARRARLWAVRQGQADKDTLRNTLKELVESLEREEALRQRTAELSEFCSELKASKFDALFEKLQEEIDKQLPTHKRDLQVDEIADLKKKNKDLLQIIADGTPQEVYRLTQSVKYWEESCEELGMREDALQRRVAELRAEVTSTKKSETDARVELSRIIERMEKMEQETAATIRSYSEKNGEQQRKIRDLTSQLSEVPDGSILAEVYENLDTARVQCKAMEDRAQKAEDELKRLRAKLRAI